MSLQEGLRRNHSLASPLDFELVYWADIQYPSPIPETEIDNHYIAADGQGPLLRYEGIALGKVLAIAEKCGGRAVDKGKDLIGLSEQVDHLLGIDLSISETITGSLIYEIASASGLSVLCSAMKARTSAS
ncbi:MAG: hypothetical protein E8D47_11735 [Nitrospira sp.]|nr:MAG: hypothetical protein E8D47_11735 [Nitrospira sp.]